MNFSASCVVSISGQKTQKLNTEDTEKIEGSKRAGSFNENPHLMERGAN
jgi:hypothetical protein